MENRSAALYYYVSLIHDLIILRMPCLQGSRNAVAGNYCFKG